MTKTSSRIAIFCSVVFSASMALANSGDDSRLMDILNQAKAPAICTLGFCVQPVQNVVCSTSADLDQAECIMESELKPDIKVVIEGDAASEMVSLLTASGAVPECQRSDCKTSVKKISCSSEGRTNSDYCKIEL